MRFVRLQFFAAMEHAARHFLQHFRFHAAIDRCHVFLDDFVARVCQPQGELSIIRQENQPFCIVIETADRIEVVPLAGEQFVNGGAVEFVLAGANAAAGFVEGDVELAFGADGLAIDGDFVVERIDFGAELADDLAVDFDAAIEDELFAGATRGSIESAKTTWSAELRF